MSKVIELKRRLRGIDRINAMTQAMQVVAVAQLKQVQGRQVAAGHYRKHYDRLAKRLQVDIQPETPRVKPVALAYLLTSERGFCGSFNESLVPLIGRFTREQQAAGRETRVVVVGGRGCEICQGGAIPNVQKMVRERTKLTFELVAREADEALRLFRQGEVAGVHLLFNEFHSMMEQVPAVKQVLPLDLGASDAPAEELVIAEPELTTVRREIAGHYVRALFYDAFLQSLLGEIAARLLTMRGATQNSREMMDALKLKLNKARQSLITYELSEIVSSFEILKEGEV